MSDSTPQYIFSARHGLDIARALSMSNETNAAIRVLEDAIRLFDEDDRLVIELERLRSLSDDLVGLDKYSQIVNERSTESRKVVDKEISSRDLSYLDLRARELEEDEFDFMSEQDVSRSSIVGRDRTTITLKRDRIENCGPKIVWKNRSGPSDTSSDENVTTDMDAFTSALENLSDCDVSVEPLMIEPVNGLTTSTESQAGWSSELTLINLGTNATVAVPVSSIPDDAWSSNEEEFETLLPSTISSDDIGDEPSELLELDLFNFWEDQFDDNDGEDDDAPLTEVSLGSTIGRAERARQVATHTVAKMGWDLSKLDLVEEVFFALGWNSARRAFEDAVANGASYEEMSLAFQIKTMWISNPRYWLSFYRFWMDGEDTFGTCRTCSWPNALALVRIFSDLPTFEDIVVIVENEFDRWYGSNLLRHKFPSFHHYIFGARLISDDPYQSLIPDIESFTYQGITNPFTDQFGTDTGFDVNDPDILFRVNFVLDNE